ncbi:MAG: sigma factor-like helix-turn-helix DNA-binding protein [Oligoflexales bacterium]
MSQTKSPRQDLEGGFLSKKQLKVMTKSWDQGTWDHYLQEEVESGRTESLLDDPWKIDEYETGYGDIAKESMGEEKILAFKKKLGSLLRLLSEKEQRIIFLIFWKGLSQREIARVLKLSRGSVENTRNRAFQKLGSAWIKEMLQKEGNKDEEQKKTLRSWNEKNRP